MSSSDNTFTFGAHIPPVTRPYSLKNHGPDSNHAHLPQPRRCRLLQLPWFPTAVGPGPLRKSTVQGQGVVQLGHRDRGWLAPVIQEVHPVSGRSRPYGTPFWRRPRRVFPSACEKVAGCGLQV